MNPKTNVVDRPLTEQIRELALSGQVTLPPLPDNARRVMEVLGDDSMADVGSIVGIVRTDPAIVAALLKTANSAFFAGLPPVTDLPMAVSRIGMRRVGSIVLTLQQKAQYESKDPDRTRFLHELWVHTLATALTARTLARQAGADCEESYLAGLLHDIGMILVLRSLDHLIGESPALELSPSMRDEVLKATHAELGGHALSEWGLPGPLCNSVSQHHANPDTITDELVLRLQAADAIARSVCPDPIGTDDIPLEDMWVIERLGMSDIELAALIVDVEGEVEQLRMVA